MDVSSVYMSDLYGSLSLILPLIFFRHTLESVIDVGQGISLGPGRFGKKNKRKALN